MEGVDIRNISRLRYEYGRVSAVVCEWEEAEAALNDAFQLDKKAMTPDGCLSWS
jgi:hypothetical protein